jgi:hypothetical protein
MWRNRSGGEKDGVSIRRTENMRKKGKVGAHEQTNSFIVFVVCNVKNQHFTETDFCPILEPRGRVVSLVGRSGKDI